MCVLIEKINISRRHTGNYLNKRDSLKLIIQIDFGINQACFRNSMNRFDIKYKLALRKRFKNRGDPEGTTLLEHSATEYLDTISVLSL